MYKLENSIQLDDGSLCYSNEHNVLEIDSKHRWLKFNNKLNPIYSESVFSTTGKNNWNRLVDEYNRRCFISNNYGHLILRYVDSKPYKSMKDDAFIFTIQYLEKIIKE